jgi:putative serine protease PepD
LSLAAAAGAVAATLVVVALGASGGAAVRGRSVVAAPGSTGTQREVASTALSADQIYERDAAGVVSIKAVTQSGEDSGTGIVLNDEGLILTNDHVVQGATSLTVNRGGSSQARSATLVGEEANGDLALIRVNPSGLGLKPLKLVSSSSVHVGDAVYAIGNPYGLEETMTRGIVSALGREIQAPDGAKITGAIQTDAALNPGNSGGPLLNEAGDVIGVNSQIASDATQATGSQPGSTGVGFAISANTVAEAVKKIEAGNGVGYGAGGQSQSQPESGISPESSTSPESEAPSTESPRSREGFPSPESSSPEQSSPVVPPAAGETGEAREGQEVIVP